MQRLFSTFPNSWPGAGLLLMRLVAAIVLIDHGVARLASDPAIQLSALSLLAVGSGLLLLAGLWTPVAGTLVVAVTVYQIFLRPENLSIYILLGTLGAALAMIGPGACSIDARLFGRKHIDIRER